MWLITVGTPREDWKGEREGPEERDKDRREIRGKQKELELYFSKQENGIVNRNI